MGARGAQGFLTEAKELLLRRRSGKIGVAMLLLFLLISVYVLVTYPPDFGPRVWNSPSYWADYPKSAPPAWINLLLDEKLVEHRVVELGAPTSTVRYGGGLLLVYEFRFNHDYNDPPSFISLKLSGVTFYDRPPTITMLINRPDGREIRVLSFTVPPGPPGEEGPYTRYVDSPLRIQITNERRVVDSVVDFYRREFGVNLNPREVALRGVEGLIFGYPAEGPGPLRIESLKGEYVIEVRVRTYDGRDRVGRVAIVVGGKVFGVLGTDAYGRDVMAGLLYGFPVALMIGFIAATLTTAIGTTLGLISGYKGGGLDTVIQRVTDVVANLPLLPLLIFLIFVLGQKMLNVILVLVAFGWPGITIIVRAMTLQIKNMQHVEAAMALGASTPRVVFMHIMPHIAPYILANVIFGVPAAILAEAAISFLGLGDPTLPTWGQMLESGFRTGAVYLGMWWWVIPPGLMIVVTALAFLVIALELEPLANPKLREVR